MANKRILLVDNEDNSKLVRFVLERAGYEIIEARTSQQGIDLAHTEQPDMILMELSLPKVNGWTAARELKADPLTTHIPTYALTAHTQPGDRARAMDSGFDGFLSKPINVHSFASAVAECLRSYKRP